VLIAVLLALGLMGAGLYSLDGRLPLKLNRAPVFVLALVLGLLGAA
jgi:hypothetical protein